MNIFPVLAQAFSCPQTHCEFLRALLDASGSAYRLQAETEAALLRHVGTCHQSSKL
jgi:hypothetical protein